MKGKIFLTLFALPFFGIGVWMGYSIGTNAFDAWQMRNWEPTQATLSRAGYERHSGDDSDTYEAYATFHYEFSGQQYSGTRVSIAGGADNIGDYQYDLGHRLSLAMSRDDRITVYVDPTMPSMAIVDRTLRWELVGFKSIFFFVFGGVGLALLVFTIRAPKEKDQSALHLVEKPWLVNDDWQTADVRSNSRGTMFFCWGFAAIWNLISAPLPFIVYEEVTEKGNTPAYLGLLFPLVGIGLLIWAIRRTLEWNRFGAAPVALDPFPGSIGGHVGGTIDINVPFELVNQFSVTLSCIHSYISGSGDNRSRRENAKWQDRQVAQTSATPDGSRLMFRFDVPPNLAESDADRSEDSYNLWRINLNAQLAGTDLDRDYDIPVYATAEQSIQLSDFSVDKAKAEQRKIDNTQIEKQFELSFDENGKTLFFPMGRNLLSGVMALLFGSIFSGVGWFLIMHENHPFMGGLFGFVGGIVVVVAFYQVLNSLQVIKKGGELHAIRRVLGFKVSHRKMLTADFVRFRKKITSQTQSGNKHTVRYSISAVNRQNERMVIAEGFSGESEAEAAMEFISNEFGLVVREESKTQSKPALDQYNVLTAD